MSPARHRQLKAVLFDKDGTLLDFHATWSPILREVALDLTDGDAEEAFRLLKIGGFDTERDHILPGSVLAAGNSDDLVSLWYPDATEGNRRALRQRIDGLARARAVTSVPVDGLADTLDALAGAGYALGVATSDATEAACAGIDALGLSHRFCRIIGYDAVPRPKPAPDMVLAFCAAASVAPAEVVVVGDSRHDLAMARAAGTGAAVGVLSGTSGHDDLATLADAVIADIGQLPNWLADYA